MDIYSCCCAHPHKEDCKWIEIAKTEGHLKAHELHMPTCKCSLWGNLHRFDSKPCAFADKFLYDYSNWDYYDRDDIHPDCVKLCCCSPEMPHDESMKFILLNKDDLILD